MGCEDEMASPVFSNDCAINIVKYIGCPVLERLRINIEKKSGCPTLRDGGIKYVKSVGCLR